MKVQLVVVCLLAAAAAANGMLAPGKYSLRNVAFTSDAVYLGFNNKTCDGQAVLFRNSTSGSNVLWKAWEVTITGYHSSGAALAVVSTGQVPGKTIRCPGQLTAIYPTLCTSSKVGLDAGAKQKWRFVEVPGKNNTYYVVANKKTSGCPRYLTIGTVSSSRPDLRIRMSKPAASRSSQWEFIPLKLGTAKPGKCAITSVVRTSNNATTATVSFTAPTDTGCAPLTKYLLAAGPSGSAPTTYQNVSSSATSTTFTGLTANKRYTFVLTAVNSCGSGEAASYVETLVKSDGVVAAGCGTTICAVKTDSSLKCLETEAFGGCSVNVGEVPTKWRKGNDVVGMMSNAVVTAVIARNGSVGVWGETVSEGCIPNSGNPKCPSEAFLSGASSVHGWSETTCITLRDGRAQCFGKDLDGLDIDMREMPGYIRDASSTPNGIGNGYLTGVAKVKAGQNTACAVYKNNNLRCWGMDDFYGFNRTVLPIEYFIRAVDVGIYDKGICALITTGNITLTCSSIEERPAANVLYMPMIPRGFTLGVEKLDCGPSICCALKTNGDFTCWGETDLADSSTQLTGIPRFVVGISKTTNRCPPEGQTGSCISSWPVVTNVVSFSIGADVICMLRGDGHTQCWTLSGEANNAIDSMLTVSGYDQLW